MYDEEVGYCQGQSFISAVLLLHVGSTLQSDVRNTRAAVPYPSGLCPAGEPLAVNFILLILQSQKLASNQLIATDEKLVVKARRD